MTLTQAATILGTSPDVLRQAIARGALKAAKHGRDWWVEPAEVERYGRENRRWRYYRTLPPTAASPTATGERDAG